VNQNQKIQCLFPFIHLIVIIIGNVIVYFVIYPFIFNIVSSGSYNITFFLISLFSLFLISFIFISHKISTMRIQKNEKVCTAQVIEKHKFASIDGEATYFRAVGLDGNIECEFFMQIYPFTKTKIGGSYSVHYIDPMKKNKCFIQEDERLISRLFYVYSAIHFTATVIISLLM